MRARLNLRDINRKYITRAGVASPGTTSHWMRRTQYRRVNILA